MAMTREELEKKIMASGSAEEIAEMLKAEGREIAPEKAAELYEEAKVRQGEVKTLSLDELDAVSGGEVRDWLKQGCAATVEYGSDCWGSDGGCSIMHNQYYNEPDGYQRCVFCGGQVHYGGTVWYWVGFADDRNREVYKFTCPKCGLFYVDKDTRQLVTD